MKKMTGILGGMMTFVMSNCDKATFLISKKEITNLNFLERFRLKIHLISCSYCRKFAQQSGFITRHVNSIGVIDPNSLKIRLTDGQKACIQHKLDSELGS